jgi:hypothetical protein
MRVSDIPSASDLCRREVCVAIKSTLVMSNPWYSERIYQKDSPTFLVLEILSSPLSEFRSPQCTVILHIQPLMHVSCEEILHRHPGQLTQQELVLSEDRLTTFII